MRPKSDKISKMDNTSSWQDIVYHRCAAQSTKQSECLYVTTRIKLIDCFLKTSSGQRQTPWTSEFVLFRWRFTLQSTGLLLASKCCKSEKWCSQDRMYERMDTHPKDKVCLTLVADSKYRLVETIMKDRIKAVCTSHQQFPQFINMYIDSWAP